MNVVEYDVEGDEEVEGNVMKVWWRKGKLMNWVFMFLTHN